MTAPARVLPFPDAPNIHDALGDVMEQVTAIGKGDKNDFHKFMFRGIDRVLDAVGPAFREHRIVPMPKLLKLESRDLLTDKGKQSREVTVTVTYTFHGPAGDSMSCTVPGEAADTGDKAVSKAMSVAYRTALIQALAIPTGETDPDASTMVRGGDPLVDVKNKIMAAAEAQEWNVERLAFEFGEWSQGGDIRSADLDTLKDYLKVLKPPRKMQRAPINEPALDAS